MQALCADVDVWRLQQSDILASLETVGFLKVKVIFGGHNCLYHCVSERNVHLFLKKTIFLILYLLCSLLKLLTIKQKRRHHATKKLFSKENMIFPKRYTNKSYFVQLSSAFIFAHLFCSCPL